MKFSILTFATATAGGVDVTNYGPFDNRTAAEDWSENNLSDAEYVIVSLVDPDTVNQTGGGTANVSIG